MLSLISLFDWPLSAMTRSSSRTTRWLDKDVSAVRAYAFPGAYIDDRQDPEPAPVGQLVRHKVERPAFVGNQRLRQRRSHAYSPFTAIATANRQLDTSKNRFL